MGMRIRYIRRSGKTWVSCTSCGENLVPAPTSFEEDPICRDCRPTSQRRHFALLAGGLVAAELAVVLAVLGLDGIARVWSLITPW